MTRDAIIMVAPTGARKTKSDHSELPISIEDTVREARLCFEAGASALHAHVRGDNDEHLLDAGLYRELIAEMSRALPQMLVQITSEAVGRYSPQQQVECIKTVVPQMSSMALREITSDFTDTELAREYFAWCLENDVHIQHILFSSEELTRFLDYREQGIIPETHRCVLFVLGRYSANFQSDPADLDPFLQNNLSGLDWFACAFGHQEQACVMSGIRAGGHARVGFENNLYLPNGEVADNTAALVSSLVVALRETGLNPANGDTARQLLGIRSA